MNYLQPNLTNTEALNIIRTKIQKEEPFSLIRFGDGENYVLRKTPPSEAINKKYCQAFGYNYPEESKNFWNDSYERVSSALINADMIGVMDFTTKIGKLMERGDDWKIYDEEFNKITGREISSLMICDHMICRSEEMGALSSMKELCDGKDIHIVSPNVEALKENNIGKILEANVTYTKNPYSINFNNRDSVIREFENISAPVVLFGSSLNKDYGTILTKEYGKIALDMGATLDAWASMMTRNWFKNSQSYLVPK